MYKNQISTIISTYTADVMGVATALYELGGMTVMHDASGCNSTYNTHDEPRWYDIDSMVYISALTETEAIMGDDEKLINDIASASKELRPEFIAVAGTPVPMMTGTDLKAVARIIEKLTGIPSFGFQTNGMHSYIDGASDAFFELAQRFVNPVTEKTYGLSVNILGLTPLDFSINSTVNSIKNVLRQNDIQIVSSWAMGSNLSDIKNSAAAHVNLVVSQCGMKAAMHLNEKFDIPYVVGVPVGKKMSEEIINSIKKAAEQNRNIISVKKRSAKNADVAIIGEGVFGTSLAKAVQLETGKSARVICPLTAENFLITDGDSRAFCENDIKEELENIKYVIADPLYKTVCPEASKFLSLPHEAFSGRLFRKKIPDLVTGIDFSVF